MTEIVITNHTKERMALRRISPMAIEATCLRPTETTINAKGQTVFIKRFANFPHPLFAVVDDTEVDKLVVITAYWKGFKTTEERRMAA